jgi:hypothetical protein
VAFKKQKLNANDDASAAPITPEHTPDAPEVDVVAAATVAPAKDVDVAMVDADAPMPQTKGKTKAAPKAKAASPKKTPKNGPIADAFVPWKPVVTVPEAAEAHWGCKPVSGDELPHPDQPSARESDASVVPPLWEDRGYRLKRGSKHVKYFGPIAPEGVDGLPDLNQEDLLVLKLLDMRPKSKYDQTPRRIPTFYAYEHGMPRDWDSMQAIKALNDRRGQAIDRIVQDAPWTNLERQFLAQLCREHPDASIWQLTMLHNDRFKDKESAEDTAFAFAPLSTGRTVESVRHQYMTYKPAYLKGEAPRGIRWRNDPSPAGLALRKSNKKIETFGAPNKALEKEFDDQSGAHAEDSDDDDETPTKKGKKVAPKKKAVKKSAATNEDSDEDAEVAVPEQEQPKLSPEEEELLDLAGFNNPGEIRTSPPLGFPTDSPLADVPTDNEQDDQGKTRNEAPRATSPFDIWADTDSVLSDPPSDFEEFEAINQLVSETIIDLVDQTVQFAETQKQVQNSQVAPTEVQEEVSVAVQEVSVAAQEATVVQEASTVQESSAVTETVETRVDVQVTTEVISTSQETAPATPPHAARALTLDEDYDDCEDEEL